MAAYVPYSDVFSKPGTKSRQNRRMLAKIRLSLVAAANSKNVEGGTASTYHETN